MSNDLKASVDATLKNVSFNSGNPVFDGVITILSTRNCPLDQASIEALQKSLAKAASAEPGGLQRISNQGYYSTIE